MAPTIGTTRGPDDPRLNGGMTMTPKMHAELRSISIISRFCGFAENGLDMPRTNLHLLYGRYPRRHGQGNTQEDSLRKSQRLVYAMTQSSKMTRDSRRMLLPPREMALDQSKLSPVNG